MPNSQPFNLIDHLGRKITYLRLSITDRCNFHCAYCRGDNQFFIPHSKIISYEHLLRFAKITTGLGVEKIRITGGEPFMRKGCLQFIADLRSILPDTRLCITTNGSLLEPFITDLCKLNLSSLNISLDTFNKETFAKITRSDTYNVIISNIDKLISAGLRVKINAVAMTGITDVQIDDFIYAVKTMPLDIRFIEFMPMGSCTKWNNDQFLSARSLMALINQRMKLHELPRERAANSGPAKMYSIEGAMGRFGFITPLSQHFCNSCNRLRMTSEGNLRLCLFADKEYRFRGLLKRKTRFSDDAIARIIEKTLVNKPIGANLLAAKQGKAVALKQMDGIGG